MKNISVEPVSSHIEAFKKACIDKKPRISTGLNALDKCLEGGLYSDLYLMTAETSTGKSAFMAYMAERIAQMGNNVLYFSFEMSIDELIARGISEISYRKHIESSSNPCYTTGDILYHHYDDNLKDFTKVPYDKYENYANTYFESYGNHFHIIECGLDDISANDIANIVHTFKEKDPGAPLVVFIDYLQLLSPDKNDKSQSDRKTKTDVAVKTLKALASQEHVPVFTVSSVGRSSYGKEQALGSSKESGDTEYTAGLVLGWNWDGVTNAEHEDDAIAEKDKCEKRGYREMKLSILKFRNAARDCCVKLYYYPAYNYFSETQAEFTPTNNTEVPLNDSNSDNTEWPECKPNFLDF